MPVFSVVVLCGTYCDVETAQATGTPISERTMFYGTHVPQGPELPQLNVYYAGTLRPKGYPISEFFLWCTGSRGDFNKITAVSPRKRRELPKRQIYFKYRVVSISLYLVLGTARQEVSDPYSLSKVKRT